MMSTSITKQGTSLASTSQEELQKLSAKAGMVPSTPAGTVAIGGTPQQAAMTGTPAQKPARIDGAGGTKQDTLQNAQRLSGPSAQALGAPEKLDRMKQLGSMNSQVEGLVQGYMQQMQEQQAALSLNTTTLGMVDETRRAPLETALNEYKGALTEAQKEAAVIKAGQALGRPLTQAEMTSYFAGAPEALGALAKSVTPESVSLRDLNLSASGVNLAQVASDLGVSEDELAGLTLPQLNQKIAELEQAEFAEASAAEAESLSAVGNRAKQLQTERQAMGQSGQIAYEEQFDRLAQDIENAGVVKVAGREMTIDSLLSDETLSDIISGAALNTSELNKLKQTEPELAAWVEQYKTALLQLSKDAGLVAADVVDRQTEFSELTKNVSSDLFMSMFGGNSDIKSAAELEQLKADMAASPLWQALSTDSALRARLEMQPDAAASLKNLTAEELATTMSATKAAEANLVLADLMGWSPGGILTPQQVDFVNTWKDELAALPPAIASDKTFQTMLKSGQLTEQQASLLAAEPSLWDEYRAEQKSAQELSRVQNEGDFLEMLTGDSGFGLDDFNDAMTSLRAWANTGDERALGYYTTLQKALTGPDGQLDLNDVQKALQDMSGSKADLGAILEGKGGLGSLMKKLSTTLMDGAGYSDTTDPVRQHAIEYLKNDQVIDASEMSHMIASKGTDFAKRLLASPWVPNRTELAEVFNGEIRQKADANLTTLYNNIKGMGAISGFRATPTDVSFTMSPSILYSELEQLPAYKAQIQNSINSLKDWEAQSAGDPTYARAAASLEAQLDKLDIMEGMAKIQKEFLPNAQFTSFTGNGDMGALLEGLRKLEGNAKGANILEPGLSADQIYQRFKQNYKPYQASGTPQETKGKPFENKLGKEKFNDGGK